MTGQSIVSCPELHGAGELIQPSLNPGTPPATCFAFVATSFEHAHGPGRGPVALEEAPCTCLCLTKWRVHCLQL